MAYLFIALDNLIWLFIIKKTNVRIVLDKKHLNEIVAMASLSKDGSMENRNTASDIFNVITGTSSKIVVLNKSYMP